MNPLWWSVRSFTFTRRPSDPGPYTVLIADLNLDVETCVVRRVELTASPTGRNVHVYVDGKRYEEAK